MFDSLHIRQNLGELLSRDISGELQRPDLIGRHVGCVVHALLADQFQVIKQRLGLDLLSERLPSRPPPVVKVSVLFSLRVSHLRALLESLDAH